MTTARAGSFTAMACRRPLTLYSSALSICQAVGSRRGRSQDRLQRPPSHATARPRLRMANKGLDTRTLQAYLGHHSINSTTRYAAIAPGRFKNIWGKA
jgi:integrase